MPRLPVLLAEDTATAGFSAMGNVSSAVGFDAGFDRFEDLYRDQAVIERRAATADDGSGDSSGDGNDGGDPPGVPTQLARAGARLLSNRELAAWAARNPRLALERYRRTHDADLLLFDLRADPVETHNVLADHLLTVRRLEGALEDWLADCRALNREWGSSDRGLDAGTEEQLRQQGYLE